MNKACKREGDMPTCTISYTARYKTELADSLGFKRGVKNKGKRRRWEAQDEFMRGW